LAHDEVIVRIAHLSDMHLLQPRTVGRDYSLSARLVSLSRPLEAGAREANLRNALAHARHHGADHVLLSGDLTETGEPAQFEQLAAALHGSGIPPLSITLVPGNHDAYASPDSWKRAIEGPLRAFAASSATEPGKIVERGDAVFLPLDLSRHQSIARAGGELTAAAAEAVRCCLEDTGLAKKAVVVVQHHPPFGLPKSAWQFLSGLRGYAKLIEVLGNHPEVQLVHGHLHRAMDRIVGGLGRARVFGASATVDDRAGEPRVRFYDVKGGTLVPVAGPTTSSTPTG
jgi:3',5'-cyclic AMP phosphodiesterase CpdA